MTSPQLAFLYHAAAAIAAVAALSVYANADADAAVPRLDPAAYEEPSDAEYWGRGAASGPPFAEQRWRAADLSREAFDRMISDGQVFVIEDLGNDWPMASWDCDFFQQDPEMSKAEMNQQYAAGGGSPFVGFKSDWREAKTTSGAKDKDAPQLAPFYWGIKDVQYEDAYRSRTWKKSMLKRVQEHVKIPPFMDPQNLRSFETTPEFWFAGAGAGAKAHMDSHVQATMSIQLAGTKRWRLGPLAARKASFLAMIYQDGQVYESSEPWAPQFSILLHQGEALFFPPGFVHETLNVNSTSDSCSASVTFQFSSPMASRFYRRFLPRVRRTADIHEAWPLVASWASLFTQQPKSGMPYAEARAKAVDSHGQIRQAFDKADKDKDESLSGQELVAAFGSKQVTNLLGFHDLNDDGAIHLQELAECFAFWAGTVKDVLDDTPPMHRRYQLVDMEEMNIEDLPKSTQKKMRSFAQDLEAKRRGAKAGKPRVNQEL